MVIPVQLQYLLSLPLPNAVEEVSYDEILSERLDRYEALMPDWSGSTDSPLYKIAEAESFREFSLRQIINRNIRKSLLPYASDSTLKELALWAGIEIDSDDDNNTSRLKIINRVRNSPLTKPGLIALAKLSDVPVSDSNVDFTFILNKWRTNVHALGPDGRDLTTQEKTDLQTWMNMPSNTILDIEAKFINVTKTPLAISITVYYNPSIVDGASLASDTRQAIYDWIDVNSVLGNTIYKGNLEKAAEIAGVHYAVVSLPANDKYTATTGQVYTFKKEDSDTGVKITVATL